MASRPYDCGCESAGCWVARMPCCMSGRCIGLEKVQTQPEMKAGCGGGVARDSCRTALVWWSIAWRVERHAVEIVDDTTRAVHPQSRSQDRRASPTADSMEAHKRAKREESWVDWTSLMSAATSRGGQRRRVGNASSMSLTKAESSTTEIWKPRARP